MDWRNHRWNIDVGFHDYAPIVPTWRKSAYHTYRL